MNRAFGVEEYAQSSSKPRRGGRARLKPKRWTVLRWAGAFGVLTLALSMGLVQARTAAGNPDHSAGDYFMFAKAAGDGTTTDRKAFEPACDTGQHEQAKLNGSTNTIHGRIHSNADLLISGSSNVFNNTPSPNNETTFGVNDNAPPPSSPDCIGDVSGSLNNFAGGGPTNIVASGNPTAFDGPHLIGPKGWPGNLGDHLNADGMTFGTDITQVLGAGAICNRGSLTSGTPITIVASDNNSVVCNGTGEILFNSTLTSSAANPFRITLISHGLIDFSASSMFYAPAENGHGILAWTDQRFSDNATAIKFAGSSTNVVRRSILFTPRSGQSVSGSVNATLCVQMIGQGSLIASGSTVNFGPLNPNCARPATVTTDIHAVIGANSHFSLGQSGAVEVGTQVHDQVTVASNTSQPLTGSMDFRRFNTGNCEAPIGASSLDQDVPGSPASHMFDNILPFTSTVAGVFSYQAEYNGDATNLAAQSPCEGPIRFVDARITLTPGTGTNAVGDPHELTADVDVNDGEGFDPAPDGTTISFVVESGTGTLTAASCMTSGGLGSCSVTLNNTAAGTDTVSASTTVTVSGVSVSRSTAGNAGPQGSGNATKTWVDANIQITPATGANEVNTPHQLIGHVNVNPGTGFVNAPAGTQINFSIASGPGTLSAASCSTDGTTGSCSVNLQSAVAGVTTVNASTAVVVGGETVNRTTNGVAPNSGPATKNWVAVRMAISPPTDANEVGTNHELTITLERSLGNDLWAGVADQLVTATITNSAGASAVFVPAGANTCTTNASGTCTVTISSPTAGSTSVDASWAGGTVEGATITAKSTNPDASKTWVAVRMAISPPTDANEVGTNHELTITLERSLGNDLWAGVADQLVTATITNSAGASAVFVPAGANTCTTNASGTCTVTISSPTAGSTSVDASWAGGTVEGATITAKSTNPDASKTWVAVRMAISPPTDANEVGTNHELTITLERSLGNDLWAGVADQLVTATITNSAGASAVFVPAGANTCTTNASGTCTVTISSPTAGSTSVDASWAGGTVEGATITAKSTNPDASKTWVAVRMAISPPTDANEVGTNHELTITLERSLGNDLWAGVADQLVTATITNSAGASAVFVPAGANTCTTNASGTCTVTISSPTAGSTSVDASWAGGTVEGATITAKSTNPDASKTWVAVRIGIGPGNATNPVGSNHLLTITLEQSVVAGTWTPINGETVTASLTNTGGATAVFVGPNTCVTSGAGQCTVTISSPTPGTTTVEATWAGGTVAGAAITAKVTDPDATKLWQAAGATLLIIDEDSIDNGIHFNASGGLITPSGPQFFGVSDVNDDRPGTRQRTVLRYFSGANIGRAITVKTGQTGDEGWFAPTCIPQKWVSGSSNTCLEGSARQTGLSNYFGANGSSAIPAQSRLDKIPAVMPLRALGLNSLIGRKICAVVYDSDISINYNGSSFPFTDGNLQGETLGVIAFTVTQVRTLNGFSSSTLPQVTLTINDASGCNTSELFNAPVPTSSSVPNDRIAPGSPDGYRQPKTFPGLPLFF